MAMILDAFVGKFAEKLVDLIQEPLVRLLGVEEDLEKLRWRLDNIKNLLVDAERRRYHETAIDAWISQLKDVMYDADDMIDLWRIKGPHLLPAVPSSSSAPSKFPSKKVQCCVSMFSCFTSLPVRNEIALEIQRLNVRLNDISKNMSEFNLQHIGSEIHIGRVNPRQTSELVDTDIVGDAIEDATKELVELLVSRNQQQCLFVAISGMGGIGKTTLAQKIFNESRIKTHFSLKVWVCISQDFNEINSLKQIIEDVSPSSRVPDSKTGLLRLLENAVSDKKVLFVLDDVWPGQENVWDKLLKNPVKGGASICRILVTTRDENVARKMGASHIHRVNQLSTASGWELLRNSVFVNGDEEEDIHSLEDTGIKIVEKCHGLPLAIKAISGILKTKNPIKKEWEDVLTNNAWSMSQLPEEVRGALYLSYEDLPSHLKQCFLYLSLFREDYIYYRLDLVRMWVAEGFVKAEGDLLLEDLAEGYYEELIRRNLLQIESLYPDGSRCKMHDLLRSLAKYLSGDEGFYGNPQGLNTTVTVRLRRLSMENSEDAALTSAVEVVRESLRTLITFGNSMFKIDMFVKLTHLRVLDLTESKIESLPETLGNMVHLRLLDLDRTRISMIPESIGSLANLQILNLTECELLHTLPRGITQLRNLRRLGVTGTPLHCLPKGIGGLKQLNDLEGFFVGEDTSTEETRNHRCSLDELGSLSQLRQLHIHKLERASTASFTFANNNPHLKKLIMSCTPLDPVSSDNVPYSELENLFEQLSPPQCIEELQILDYFGRGFPSWMMSTSQATSFSYLTFMNLHNCILCPLLPSLGQLPQLKLLLITGASSVVTIGPEFLGVNSRNVGKLTVLFPKLEQLWIHNMAKWEEWSFGKEIDEQQVESLELIRLLPRLKHLELVDCPELRALPKGLSHCCIQELYIKGARKLTRVDNLPYLTKWMQVMECGSLERVSDLPALRRLIILECPSLMHVERLDSLRSLHLRDDSMKCLPEWLWTLIQQRRSQPMTTTSQDDDDANFHFQLDCNMDAVRRCCEGCPDWPIIQQIPRVVYDWGEGTARLEYNFNF